MNCWLPGRGEARCGLFGFVGSVSLGEQTGWIFSGMSVGRVVVAIVGSDGAVCRKALAVGRLYFHGDGVGGRRDSYTLLSARCLGCRNL